MAYTEVNSAAKVIFKNFMVRQGWTYADAAKELELLLATPYISVCRDQYVFRASRVGLRGGVSRKGRIEIWETWQNAINHSNFCEE